MEKSLEGFCRLMLEEYGSPGAIAYDIERLARHFVDYFELSSYPDLREIKLLLDQRHRVATVRPGYLGGLPACHYLDRMNRLYIEYEEGGWLGRSEHSIMHECYEALQTTCEDMVPGYRAYRDPTDMCMKPYADKFAAAVLMQKDVFIRAIRETGLDICSLRRYFAFSHRSYSSVAIRIKELLKPPVVAEGTDFLIAIYARGSDGEPDEWDLTACPEEFYAECVVKTQGILLSRNKRGASRRSYLLPRRLLPVKGEKPVAGSIVEQAIRCQQPLCYQDARFDLLGTNDMTILARPVYWKGRIAKAILVAVRKEDSYLLGKQLEELTNLKVVDTVYIS
ncbi:MAG: hypothetical protein ACLFVK_05510 [Dehalococcoidia bacterium]